MSKNRSAKLEKRPIFTRVRLSDCDPCPCGGVAQRVLAVQNRLRTPITSNDKSAVKPTYGQCCAPLHRGERNAESALELMSARYSAYAAHEAEYVWQTWHPRRRPEIVVFDDQTTWRELKILDYCVDPDGDGNTRKAIVEFSAYFTDAAGAGEMWERSNFEMRGRRWVYLDGDVTIDGKTTASARAPQPR